MAAQSAVKAQLTECYILKYPQEQDSRSERMWAADCSSLFPHCGHSQELPIGKPQILLGDEIKNHCITFDSQDMFVDGEMVQGLLHCRIVPPRNLLHPFLLSHVNGMSVAVLCSECARKRQIAPCHHNDIQRSLIQCYTSCEVAYACTVLGYKVLEYFELLIYHCRYPVLKKFLAVLGFCKIKASPYPEDVNTTEKKMKYCSSINERMQFQESLGYILTPDLMKPNPEMRQFFKMALVTFIGKLHE